MKNRLIPILLALLGFVLTGCPKMYDCPPNDFEVKENAAYVEPETVVENPDIITEEENPDNTEGDEE